jgi:hypothetical protein
MKAIQGKVTDTARINIQDPTNIKHLLLNDQNCKHPVTEDNTFSDK